MGVQATGEENIQHFKKCEILLFSAGHFSLSGSGSVFSMQIRIRIQPTEINADPDPDTSYMA
jgi:hypothetical protein